MTDDRANVDPKDLPDAVGTEIQVGGAGPEVLWWLPVALFLLYLAL